MISNFYKDLEAARGAETLVFELLVGAAADTYTFEWVGDNPAYYNLGDIRAINKATGKESFIEVKDDSRIADTGNVLCENGVDYGYSYAIGNIYNHFDCYAIRSAKENKVYLINGEILRANFKKGRRVYIEHPQQATDAFLLPLAEIKRLGGLIGTISYDLERRQASIAA